MTTASYNGGGQLTNCIKCGSHTYVMPLHGARGGPLFCFMCAGAWHAEHGRKRRAGRVVVKALRGYEKAGGKTYGKDFDQLKLAADGMWVPYEADTAGADFCDLTSELLEATIALTHPDKHPPERQAEANRVTQELLALKPFVFPAPEPEPPPKQRDVSSKQHGDDLNKPSQPAFPCEDCRDTIPKYYCNSCKAQWERQQEKDREWEEKRRVRKNARQRQLYERHKQVNRFRSKPTSCAMCGKAFKPKRSDAKYCSATCRQRAYVKRDGKASNSRSLRPEHIERALECTFMDNPDSAFTTDDLCDRVYPGLVKPERKHRAAVTPIAKKISERMGEHRTWFQCERRGGTLVFFNHASVTSYAMARLKADFLNGYRCASGWRNLTEEDLKAEIAPGGGHHEYVVEGGAWWKHCQEDIAKFKEVTAKQTATGGNLTSRHVEAAP